MIGKMGINSMSIRLIAASMAATLLSFSLALAAKNIQSVSDLMRKQFAMGKFGSGTFVTANQVLSANYIGNIEKLFDLTSEEAVKLVLSNKIDAMALVAGKPAPLFKKLDNLFK